MTFNVSSSAPGITKLLLRTVSSLHGKCAVYSCCQTGRWDALAMLSTHHTSSALPRCTCAFLLAGLPSVAPHSILDKSSLGFLLEDIIVRN